MRYFPCLTLLMFLAWEPRSSLQQVAEISITPQRAITNDKVEFACRNTRLDGAAVYFRMMHNQLGRPVEIARLDVKCSPAVDVIRQSVQPGFGTLGPVDCGSMTLTGVLASRAIAGSYSCEVQHIMRDFSQSSFNSQPVELTVGDPTPVVSQFQLAMADTGAQLDDGRPVPAGKNVSLACETASADPAPLLTVSWDGTDPLPQVRSTNRVLTYALMPKRPSVAFTCSAYNGFGVEQTSKTVVTVFYGAVHSEVVTPKKAEMQTVKEIEICSVANNPPKQLTIAGLDTKLVQPNYPRLEEKDGYSRAFVKLTDAAGSVKDLTYTCSVGGIETPVEAKVQLNGVEAVTTQESSTIASSTAGYNSSSASSAQVSTPSSAMMTIGIVIAVVVVFVVIVAGIAIALKRRSAANKASNGENSRYGKVNQNDADMHDPTYEANPVGKKSIKVEAPTPV